MAPNPIDFNKVFNANLAENPVALAAVCAIFGAYLIVAIYARREDLKDVEKVSVLAILFFQRFSLFSDSMRSPHFLVVYVETISLLLDENPPKPL